MTKLADLYFERVGPHDLALVRKMLISRGYSTDEKRRKRESITYCIDTRNKKFWSETVRYMGSVSALWLVEKLLGPIAHSVRAT